MTKSVLGQLAEVKSGPHDGETVTIIGKMVVEMLGSEAETLYLTDLFCDHMFMSEASLGLRNA